MFYFFLVYQKCNWRKRAVQTFSDSLGKETTIVLYLSGIYFVLDMSSYERTLTVCILI